MAKIMEYKVLYDNPEDSLLMRLLKIRHVEEHIDQFLDPKLADFWIDPFLLNDMEKAVDRIIDAIKNQDKIMIFGDYDVDGVTSSYILYRCFTKYLWYSNISIQYPDRINDWYGMKCHHLDSMKEKWINLVITVDNWITSIKEAQYAKELGIDMIITDHHKQLEEIPAALAVVNPQISPDYPFKWIAGVGVTFKLIYALLTKSKFSLEKKNQIFNYFLPVVAIWTVADVVPLVNENRVMVKKWLEMMNRHPEKIPSWLRGLLKFLNIQKDIDTFHIGYVIGPRINAGWRIASPYDSLYSLLHSGEKQLAHLEKLEWINTERRAMQERMFKEAESTISLDDHMLTIASEEFHEWVIGIVSGRLTEKYNKPSAVFKIDTEKWTAVASLRWPDYFDVITMIQSAGHLLERFGGHRWAGGLSVKLENLEELCTYFKDYCNTHITDENLVKIGTVDTILYSHEWTDDILVQINKLAPFGEGNQEPVFLLKDLIIHKVEKVWSSGKGHLKIYAQHGEKKVNILFWSKGDLVNQIDQDNSMSLVWKIKKDTFNGGWYIDWVEILE